jgi:hypothetical protein
MLRHVEKLINIVLEKQGYTNLGRLIFLDARCCSFPHTYKNVCEFTGPKQEAPENNKRLRAIPAQFCVLLFVKEVRDLGYSLRFWRNSND